MSDVFRGIFVCLYWLGSLIFIGWNVFNQDFVKAIIYFGIAVILYLFIFQLIWRKKRKREKGEASFFDIFDCDGFDCDGFDCDGGGGGFDGGGGGGGD
ncbi:hypothetical protein [Bacillus sp. M6-12]|uniref:hypothetical protein n=1 Tax=Bacillus sp. M6-12 TaxID=2054166 RepID=UPI00115BD9C8|nr:hypothetical protein [Bacillus sp. M6-12]